MMGAKEALTQIHEFGIPYAVVSNCSFSEGVIRYELAKYGLPDYLSFIMVSADYLARIPNRLLFDTAAARLGVESQDFWFVGDRLDTDILGAKRANMPALWFCPETQNDRSNEVDMVVSNWDEIVRHIDELFHELFCWIRHAWLRALPVLRSRPLSMLRVSSPNFGYHNILPMGAAGRIVGN
jgi:FMN phosphatase YigB (HAD superfamily)